jgi:hypothetical protein
MQKGPDAVAPDPPKKNHIIRIGPSDGIGFAAPLANPLRVRD